ncbi:hypothetical protein [Deinococcus pimensis]|uniref:hypothetical protein n=1 Tax=Deinococcus pimensis TaxID=309888 RepID=UPI0004859893|nr:hypothetical protein [Deinococcus pimensis]
MRVTSHLLPLVATVMIVPTLATIAGAASVPSRVSVEVARTSGNDVVPAHLDTGTFAKTRWSGVNRTGGTLNVIKP